MSPSATPSRARHRDSQSQPATGTGTATRGTHSHGHSQSQAQAPPDRENLSLCNHQRCRVETTLDDHRPRPTRNRAHSSGTGGTDCALRSAQPPVDHESSSRALSSIESRDRQRIPRRSVTSQRRTPRGRYSINCGHCTLSLLALRLLRNTDSVLSRNALSFRPFGGSRQPPEGSQSPG